MVPLELVVIDGPHTFPFKLLPRKPFISHTAIGASFSDETVMKTVAMFDSAPIASCFTTKITFIVREITVNTQRTMLVIL